MLALYAFWELTSVSSFLLIGFDHARQAARRAAIQALVITNLGGLALLLGALMIQHLTGQWDLSGVRETGDLMRLSPFYAPVLVLFLLAAFSKSAQFPLHFWLPNAMEAPTPVSAFLHSATMVQAGVYLLARMTPVLGETQAWAVTLTVFGGVKLLWGGFGALKQTDLKQMLAQTTIASLGLLVLTIGQGSEATIAAMVVYFVAHAFYKAGLFLMVEDPDHEEEADDDSRPCQPGREGAGLEHCDSDEDRPRPREEIAQAFPDPDPEVAMERVEDRDVRRACRLGRSRIYVPTRQRWDEERPAGDPEELHYCRQHPDDCRRGHHCKTITSEHLPQEDGKWREQDGGQHEAEPEKPEPHSARLEAAEYVSGGSSQDVRIVESTRKHEEEHVESEGQ
jgi:hypothetical protein